MIKRYYFTLFLAFLSAFAPVQGMENKPSKEEVTQFFEAIKNYFNKFGRQTYNPRNLVEIWHISEKIVSSIKKNPSIINEVNPKYGNTALDLAIELTFDGEYECKRGPNFIKQLLELGAHPTNKYFFDSNFLDQKDHENRNRIVHLLLSHGAAIESDGHFSDVLTHLEKKRDYQVKNSFAIPDNILNLDNLINIVKAHIHTRLSVAIHRDNAQDVKRLVQKYAIDINKPLYCYDWMFSSYGTASASLDLYYNRYCVSLSDIPLHQAVLFKKEAVVRCLVDELGANVNVQNKAGYTALHRETDVKIAEFLLSKGANPHIVSNDGKKTTDYIDEILDPEMIRLEIGHQTERIANLRALKKAFEAVPNVPVNNPPIVKNNTTYSAAQQNQNNQNPWIPLQDVTITDEDRKNAIPSPMPKFTDRRQGQNNQNFGTPLKPVSVEPENDPINDPTTVITKSVLPWKLIGGGVVVVAVIIAGKKLYNWYYAKTEEEKEKAETEETTNASAEKSAATA